MMYSPRSLMHVRTQAALQPRSVLYYSPRSVTPLPPRQVQVLSESPFTSTPVITSARMRQEVSLNSHDANHELFVYQQNYHPHSSILPAFIPTSSRPSQNSRCRTLLRSLAPWTYCIWLVSRGRKISIPHFSYFATLCFFIFFI